MIYMIFYKWCQIYENTADAPSIINMLISNPLKMLMGEQTDVLFKIRFRLINFFFFIGV